MGDIKHPYIPSPGVLIKSIEQFRKMFPAKIDSTVLKKLSLAPNNEGTVIAAFKFFGFIDDDGNKTDLGKKLFLLHDNSDFEKEFEKVVLTKYSDLFELQGDESWNMDRNSLIGFFRTTDGTSELTATRQAVAFETVSSLSGHSSQIKVSPTKKKKRTIVTESSASSVKKGKLKNGPIIPPETPIIKDKNSGDIGLTVRIEINLPAQGDQETYDRIFLSIKKNLLNG